MIAYPEKYKRIYTPRTVAWMVVFAWLFAFAILIPTLTEQWGNQIDS